MLELGCVGGGLVLAAVRVSVEVLVLLPECALALIRSA